jgi:hypothetical protein
MEPNKQKIVRLSASASPDNDWGNKHDPNAIVYLDAKPKGLRRVNIDLTNPDQAAALYIAAMSRPDVILHLKPTALWRANRI